MNPNNWSVESIFEKLIQKSIFDDFSKSISVRQIDTKNGVLIGLTEDGLFVFGCRQKLDLPGFDLLRAQLVPNQEIEFENSNWGRSLVLRCVVENEKEALSISSIFAGLYDLASLNSSENSVEIAAQGYENYFASKMLSKPSPSQEIGLAGELTLILSSPDPEKMIEAWHSSPFSTYDFSVLTNRLEVKTSISPRRFHWLKNSQTGIHSDSNLTYASIYLPETAGGQNVQEIVNEISEVISGPIAEVFKHKLKSYNLNDCIMKFDVNSAISEIKFVSADEVPFPKNIDPRILDLRWKIDFNYLELDEDSFWSNPSQHS